MATKSKKASKRYAVQEKGNTYVWDTTFTSVEAAVKSLKADGDYSGSVEATIFELVPVATVKQETKIVVAKVA